MTVSSCAPGSRVPVDGVLTEGIGEIDESTITGESVPVAREPGSKLHEATVNLNAVLTMEVTRTLNQSTVARMIALMTEAQGMKTPSERFSDWFVQRCTVAVQVGSVAAWLVMLGMGIPQTRALDQAATLLVAASPGALVISVPVGILSALSVAARGGVLFKGGAAPERLAEVSIFAFDKTGTLTTGTLTTGTLTTDRAEVISVVALDGDEASLLTLRTLQAAVEAHSEHPIAGAIRREVKRRGLVAVPVTEVVTIPTEGITGTDATGALWAGNCRMAARMAAAPDHAGFADLASGAHTRVCLGQGPRLLGGSRRGRPAPRHLSRRDRGAAARGRQPDRDDHR